MNTAIEDLNRWLVRSFKQGVYSKYYGMDSIQSIAQKIENIPLKNENLEFREIIAHRDEINLSFILNDTRHSNNTLRGEITLPLNLSNTKEFQATLFSITGSEISSLRYALGDSRTSIEKVLKTSEEYLNICKENINTFDSEIKRIRKEEIFNISLLLRSRLKKRLSARMNRINKIRYTFQEFERIIEKQEVKVGDKVVVGSKDSVITTYSSFPYKYRVEEKDIWTVTKIEGDYKYLEQGKKKKKVKKVYKFFLIQPEFEETARLLEEMKDQLKR